MKKNKQTVKGLLPIVGMLIISLSLSGCKKPVETDVDAETKSIKQTVGEAADSESVTEIKTIEPPEDGWTHEQISEVMYLCGKPFSLPCMLEDLPDDFEIGKIQYRNKDAELHTYITVNGQDSGFYDAQLLLDGESAGLAHYYENGTDKIVFSIDLSPDLYGREILVINGINQNSSFLEIKQALGESFVQDSDISCIYGYTVTNSEYPEEYVRFISFNDDEEIAGFCYSLFDIKKETQ